MGYLLALGAAGLWAMLGLIYGELTGRLGISPLTVAFFRAGLSFLILAPFLLSRSRKSLRLPLHDLPLFLSFGLIGIAGFYVVYVYAVMYAGMAIAVVLLYTAPLWVVLISREFLGERIGRRALLALILTMGGCSLVAQVYDPTRVQLNAVGVLLGLGAGLSYAMYTVFTKVAVQQYRPWTVVFYSLGFGALLLLPWQSPGEMAAALAGEPLVYLAFLAIGPTLGAAFLYALALERLPASIAGTVATMEPVIGILLAVAVRGEHISFPQAIGAGLIIVGVIVLSLSEETKAMRSS
ncbi:DMT family transporter [Candidatus Bipolaricaulota sp. J31]